MGTKSNRDAVGARVTARVGKLLLTREVSAGDGYGCQSALRLHFGLGQTRERRRADGALAALGGRRRAAGATFRNVAGTHRGDHRGAGGLVEKRYGALQE